MPAATFIGAGTPATGVNAPVVTTFHASTAPGDFVVVHASIRNSGVGDVTLPAGWINLVYSGHHRLMGKFYALGDPLTLTVNFTGGVALADTIVQCATFRGVSRQILALGPPSPATLLNASAQDIAFPGLVIIQDGNLVLLAAWKQDDATAVSTPAGWTGIASQFAVAGDDALQTWRYQIQTLATSIVSGTLVVTGGLAAISRSAVVALASGAVVTAIAQDSYPPRVLVSVTALVPGDAVAIYRVVSGARTLIRAGSTSAATSTAFLRVDAEIPFGIPVYYVAVVNGVETATDPVTYVLPGGKVAFSDAVTGTSAEVVISAWPEKMRSRRTSRFQPGGRNVVVSGNFTGYVGSIELLIETTSSLSNFYALLEACTEGIVQIRQSGAKAYDGVDSYVVVEAARERRYSQDGSDPKRYVTLDVIAVDGWAPTLEAASYTYGDLEARFLGLTYAELAAAYPSYLALAQADLT